MNLTPLFDPERVAVVGASRSERKIGYEAMGNAVAFDGPVHPVNPSAEGELRGEPVVDSVTDIDEPVDLALLCVPGPALPDVLAECGEAGVGGAVVYGGGFAEAGAEGRRRQAHLAEIAAENDVVLLGPNTSGFVIPRTNLLASFVGGVERFEPGSVAVVAQSGGVAHAVGFEEAITYFDADEATEAIVVHIEGTDAGRSLLETCREATTPVVAYKVGRTDVGDFAESHTGALTGDHELYDAGFAQYGVPTVASTATLLDAGVALAAAPDPRGTGVGVVTAQAGPGIIVADRLRAAGATIPDLEPGTAERVEAILPGITYAENPVDTGRPMPEFGEVVTAVAEDDNVDVVLVYELYEGALGFPVDALDGLAERVDKPVLFATEGPETEIASPAVTHKSEWANGAGVALGLADRPAVEAAARRILDAAAERGIDAEVLVERARDTSRGTEIIVGGLRDRSFGPVVLVGLGGVFAEVYDDTAHRVAPVDRAEARSALDDLTAAELLSGYRDRPAADLDALADVVVAVGDLVAAEAAIAEIEVNPALATSGGATALDALVVLADGEEQGGDE